jgi:hypothetical protein
MYYNIDGFVKNKLSWCLRVLVALVDKKGGKNG